jgi:CRP/FNR family transcriptional regulator, cyclic AMP receptor protein
MTDDAHTSADQAVVTDVNELIAGHPFLDGIAPAAIAQLGRYARRVDFPAGTRVFTEGGPARSFWLLIDGHIALDTQVPGRGAVVVESLGAGAVVGWSWLFAPHQWHFGASAVQPTTAVEFDGPQVRRLCDRDPVLGYELVCRFMRVVVDRLQCTRVRLLDLYRLP